MWQILVGVWRHGIVGGGAWGFSIIQWVKLLRLFYDSKRMTHGSDKS